MKLIIPSKELQLYSYIWYDGITYSYRQKCSYIITVYGSGIRTSNDGIGVLQSSSKETNQIGINCQLCIQLPPPTPQHHKILIVRCYDGIPVGQSIYKNIFRWARHSDPYTSEMSQLGAQQEKKKCYLYKYFGVCHTFFHMYILRIR